MTLFWVLFMALFVILMNFLIIFYNRLIGYKNEIDKMMGSIDSILKKRYDLIPNLVSIVLQYAVFERSMLERLTELRSFGIHPSMNIAEKSALASSLSEILNQYSLTVENYPYLKANASFIHLQHTIAILEEELSAARRVYNQAVTDYNNAIEMFPSNIIAKVMHFHKIDIFQATTVERVLPSLQTLFKS